MAGVIALELASDRVQVVRLDGGSSGAVVGQSFTALFPTTFTVAHAAELGHWLKSQLVLHGLQGNEAVVCLGRGQAVVKYLELPDVPASELPSMVRMALEGEMNDGELGVIDYDLSPASGGQRSVTAMIASEKTLQTLTDMCKTAGLICKRIVVRPYALRFLRDRTIGEPSAAGGHLLLAPSPEGLDVSVWNGSRLEIARTIYPNGAAPEANSGRLAAEIRRTIASYQAKSSGREIGSAAVLSGDIEVLREGVEGALTTGLALADPRTKVRSLTDAAPAWGAIAAGWQFVVGEIPAIDLMNPKKAPPPRYSLKRLGTIAAVFAAVLAASAVYWRNSKLKSLDGDLAGLQTDISAIEEQIKLNKPIEARHDDIKKWKSANVDWLRALNELAFYLPNTDEAYVQSLRAETGARDGRAKIAVTMRSRDRGPVQTAHRKIAESRQFEVDPRGTKTNTDLADFTHEEDFDIRFTSQFGMASVGKTAKGAASEIHRLAALPADKKREPAAFGAKKAASTSRTEITGDSKRSKRREESGAGSGQAGNASAKADSGGVKSTEQALSEKIERLKGLPLDQYESELLKEKPLFRNRIKKLVEEARGKK